MLVGGILSEQIEIDTWSRTRTFGKTLSSKGYPYRLTRQFDAQGILAKDAWLIHETRCRRYISSMVATVSASDADLSDRMTAIFGSRRLSWPVT